MSGMSTMEDAVTTIKHLTMLLENAWEENRLLRAQKDEAFRVIRELKAEDKMSAEKINSSICWINPYQE